MMYFPLGTAIIGFIILLLTSVFPRRFGNELKFLGLGLLALSIILSTLDFSLGLNVITLIFSSIIFLWVTIVDIQYRLLISRMISTILQPEDDQGEEGNGGDDGAFNTECTPRLRRGGRTVRTPFVKGAKAQLNANFRVEPSDDGLKITNIARGVIGGTFTVNNKTATAITTVKIICDTDCEADTSITGDIEDFNFLVTNYNLIQVIPSSSDKTKITVKVKMGAAIVDPGGGPRVSISQFGVNVALDFPEANVKKVTEMGTYKWKCNALV